MITSRLTSKAHTTVPQAVRIALRLEPGDELAYAIEDGRAILTCREAVPADDPFKAFGEWDTEAAREVVAGLLRASLPE